MPIERSSDFKGIFCKACENGDLNHVKKIHEQLQLDLDIVDNLSYYEELLNTGINDAIENSQLKIVQYIFEQNHGNGTIDTNAILNTACLYDQADIAKYILEKNKLNDLNLDIDDAFKIAFDFSFIEIIKIFVFDHNIEINDTVNKCLYMDFSGIAKEVQAMFKSRELNKQLTSELKPNDESINSKKLKV